MTPWTASHQAPLSMGFSRQEYWYGLPFPSPRDPPNPRNKLWSPALQTDYLPSEPPEKPLLYCNRFIILFTQVIYKEKNKENFNLTAQYLEKYSRVSCITTAFTLASGHPGLDIKTLHYCALNSCCSCSVISRI